MSFLQFIRNRFLPRHRVFIATPPTSPGWYWWRRSPGTEPVIIRLDWLKVADGEPSCVLCLNGNDIGFVASRMGGEFGPQIPPLSPDVIG